MAIPGNSSAENVTKHSDTPKGDETQKNFSTVGCPNGTSFTHSPYVSSSLLCTLRTSSNKLSCVGELRGTCLRQVHKVAAEARGRVLAGMFCLSTLHKSAASLQKRGAMTPETAMLRNTFKAVCVTDSRRVSPADPFPDDDFTGGSPESAGL